jgi:hypothetical protein
MMIERSYLVRKLELALAEATETLTIRLSRDLPRTAAEAGTAQMKRNGFYIYFSMIDLMANVFGDLALEDSKNPHNAGWLWIFHQWSSQPGFQQAWQIARETYGERFRRFCEREFKLLY